MRLLGWCLSLLWMGWNLTVAAQDKKDSEPNKSPLKVEVKSLKDSYKLDLGGLTAEEFLNNLALAAKGKARPPQPPAVSLEVIVTNTSKEKVDFWATGDPVQILFTLKGPQSKAITPLLPMTLEFRLPAFKTLQPGESHKYAINRLAGGMRGNSQWLYWIEPGEYLLSAQLKTGVVPVPPGAKEQEGAGLVTLTSTSIKIQVEK
jgi:hypothetical protein